MSRMFGFYCFVYFFWDFIDDFFLRFVQKIDKGMIKKKYDLVIFIILFSIYSVYLSELLI